MRQEEGLRNTNQDAAESDEEGEDVAVDGLVVLAIALAEWAQVGIEFVLAKSLEHLGGGHETGQGGTESGGKAAGVDERTKCRDQLDNLVRKLHLIYLPLLIILNEITWKLF